MNAQRKWKDPNPKPTRPSSLLYVPFLSHFEFKDAERSRCSEETEAFFWMKRPFPRSFPLNYEWERETWIGDFILRKLLLYTLKRNGEMEG